MTALNPWVDKLAKLKIPRGLSIILIYLLVLGIVGFAVAGVIPPFVDQTQTLVSRLPSYLESLRWLGINEGINERVIDTQTNQLLDKLGNLSGGVITTLFGVFQNLFNLVVLLVISFYFLLERKNLDKYLLKFFGPGGEKKGTRIVDNIEKKLGGWVRAELLMMLTIGAMSYIGLRLLGIDFALPLAILAGILEIIPIVGPFVAAIPAVLIGLVVSPITGVAVVALYFLVQQLENNLIVPKIMQKTVGIHPLVTILALIIGLKLGGIVGGILAIPTVLLMEIFASERFKQPS